MHPADEQKDTSRDCDKEINNNSNNKNNNRGSFLLMVLWDCATAGFFFT